MNILAALEIAKNNPDKIGVRPIIHRQYGQAYFCDKNGKWYTRFKSGARNAKFAPCPPFDSILEEWETFEYPEIVK